MVKGNENIILELRNGSQADPSDLTLYYCGTQQCPPAHFRTGIRDHYLIHYVLDGCGTFQINNTTFHLVKNQGFLISPNILTAYKADEENPWHYCWFAFHGQKAKQFLEQVNLDIQNPIFTYDQNRDLEECINDLVNSFRNHSSNNFYSISLLYKIFYFLSLNITEKKEDTRCISSKQKYLNAAIDFIVKNFSRKVTVQQISNYVGIDRRYLYEIFREYLQLSPQNFLIEYRMNKACELLKQGDFTISDIAYSVGYSDPFLFSKIFKKNKKTAPSSWQRQKI